MRNRDFLSCFVGPIAIGASIASAGAILHVDDDAPPAGDGLSWAGAYNSLQDALADAAGGGVSEIRVAQGVYTPVSNCCTPYGGLGCEDAECAGLVCSMDPSCCDSDSGWDAACVDLAQLFCGVCQEVRDETFQLLNGVVLAGGYAGVGAPNPDDRDVAQYETFLSGDLAGNDGPGPFENNADNSYHVVNGSGTDQTAVIDGFTVIAGNADGGGFDGAGGGMLNSFGSPTVTGCTFSGNAAVFGGGGMYNFNSSLTVTNCTITGNTSDGGGGMLNSDSSPTVANCTFSGNTACDGGGGMASFSSSLTVTNCTFSGNLAGSFGGGGMRSESSTTTVTNCTFSGNTADDGGGGMASFSSSLTVTNCTFEGNTAINDGGGMGIGGGSPTITNCTFSGNSATVGGALITLGPPSAPSNPTLSNCVLWGNGADQIVDGAGSATAVFYSNVQSGFVGTGNINVDPLFVDPGNGDVRLQPGSPCIDAGDNTAVPVGVTTDLDGNPRFADDLATTDTGNGECPIVDMGVYEFPTSCPWDLDCDATVGIADFLALLAAWGTDPGGPPDFDGDGDVGIADFLELLANWGACT